MAQLQGRLEFAREVSNEVLAAVLLVGRQEVALLAGELLARVERVPCLERAVARTPTRRGVLRSVSCPGASPGITRSTSHAAVSAMRRAPHDGQKPRPLHENATTSSLPHPAHHTRAKPCAGIPQRRNASTSRAQNRGSGRSRRASPARTPAHAPCTTR